MSISAAHFVCAALSIIGHSILGPHSIRGYLVDGGVNESTRLLPNVAEEFDSGQVIAHFARIVTAMHGVSEAKFAPPIVAPAF